MPSQYENRTTPAYDSVMQALVNPSMAANPYILKWWTDAHDKLIRKQISKWQWYWHFYIRDEILRITEAEVIDSWKKFDPACQRGVGTGYWHNVLEYFTYARAKDIGLDQLIRKPEWKRCPICENMFLENSLPEPLAKRLGINGLDFCAPCLTSRILQSTGKDNLNKEDVKKYLKSLSSLLQAIPHQGYSEGADDLLYLSSKDRLAALQLFTNKPTTSLVKKLFSSWLQALIEAEILEDGTRKTSRGTMCVAKDGHVCLSLAEKTLDDFLYAHEIPHTREPHYPDSNFRADFEIKGNYIEYFGLAGNPEYDKKIKAKEKMAKKVGINLISVYPQNLINPAWLTKTFLSI